MTETSKVIDIAKDFSPYPAGRDRTDGPFSGELFRQEHLVPALTSSKQILILLDGTEGYGSSFLEEAFGGLIREEGFSLQEIEGRINLETEDKFLKLEIETYLKDANDQLKSGAVAESKA